MPFNQFTDYRLYYEVHGEGAPLIFLHGLGGSIEQIKNIYAPIKGIKLVLIDQKCHGRSVGQCTSPTFESMAADVIAIADKLELHEFYIAGISMGAAVSLSILLNYPNRIKKALLIRNAWINKPMDDVFVKLYEITADYLAKKDSAGFLNTQEYTALAASSTASAKSFLQFFSDKAALTYHDKFRKIPKLKPFTDCMQLREIEKEVIILANHDDPIHPFSYGRFLHILISNSKLYEITGKSIDAKKHKEQINCCLKSFLSQEETHYACTT